MCFFIRDNLPVMTGIRCCDSGERQSRHTLDCITEPDNSVLLSVRKSVQTRGTTLVPIAKIPGIGGLFGPPAGPGSPAKTGPQPAGADQGCPCGRRTSPQQGPRLSLRECPVPLLPRAGPRLSRAGRNFSGEPAAPPASRTGSGRGSASEPGAGRSGRGTPWRHRSAASQPPWPRFAAAT